MLTIHSSYSHSVYYHCYYFNIYEHIYTIVVLTIERSTNLQASDSAVHYQINDYRNWNTWSPWSKIYPTITVIYDGSLLTTLSLYHSITLLFTI